MDEQASNSDHAEDPSMLDLNKLRAENGLLKTEIRNLRAAIARSQIERGNLISENGALALRLLHGK